MGKLSKVDYIPGGADIITAAVAGWAALPAELGPGLDQGDAVQLVSDMAVLRHTATLGDKGLWAVFAPDGSYRGTRYEWRYPPELEKDWTAIPIVGNERVQSSMPPGGDLPANWGSLLALALDQTTIELAKAKQASAVPTGYGSLTVPIVAPAIVAIIVGGTAVAVIGSVAAWRYLDPDFRKRIAEIRTAAKAYQDRLRVGVETGTTPPPGPLETANAAAVKDAAKKRGNRAWMYAAGAVGGLTVGTVGAALIRRELAS